MECVYITFERSIKKAKFKNFLHKILVCVHTNLTIRKYKWLHPSILCTLSDFFAYGKTFFRFDQILQLGQGEEPVSLCMNSGIFKFSSIYIFLT